MQKSFLLKAENIAEVAKAIRTLPESTHFAVFFGSEDSYLRKNSYDLLCSSNVIPRDFKPFLPGKGYRHEGVRTVEDQLNHFLTTNVIDVVILVDCQLHEIEERLKNDPFGKSCLSKCQEGGWNIEAVNQEILLDSRP